MSQLMPNRSIYPAAKPFSSAEGFCLVFFFNFVWLVLRRQLYPVFILLFSLIFLSKKNLVRICIKLEHVVEEERERQRERHIKTVTLGSLKYVNDT